MLTSSQTEKQWKGKKEIRPKVSLPPSVRPSIRPSASQLQPRRLQGGGAGHVTTGGERGVGGREGGSRRWSFHQLPESKYQ